MSTEAAVMIYAANSFSASVKSSRCASALRQLTVQDRLRGLCSVYTVVVRIELARNRGDPSLSVDISIEILRHVGAVEYEDLRYGHRVDLVN